MRWTVWIVALLGAWVNVWLSAWDASLPTLLADDFPKVYNSQTGDEQPMPPGQAAQTMKLPEGFSVEVFAAEPWVRNPIAMAWDDQHRLWIAENFTYAESAKHFDLSLRDRVLVFSDTDRDGRADGPPKVFTDDVQMLTSVETGRGGVWLMCPPKLLFIPDADGDAIADGPPQVVLDGFTVGQSSYHNFANGLRWGPDGWLYGRCGHSCPGNIGPPGTSPELRVPIKGGIWRYHPQRKVVEVLCHGTVNPWGHDWDRHGELFFINTVIGHLWHGIAGSHFKETFGESSNPWVYRRMDMIADHYHFDTSGSWTASRDGKANDFGGGHAHVGMLIYNGNVWPSAYHGKLMTINMHGRRVNVERLERTSTGYVGRHEPDLLIAEDPFFRGTDLQVGPDGHVYLIDWSDTGECHEHTGVHRESGRIYCIRGPAEAGTSGKSDAGKPRFGRPTCTAGDGPLPQLWRDYRDGKTSRQSLLIASEHDDPHMRLWALRLLTDFWPLDTIQGPPRGVPYPNDQETQQRLLQMASSDPSGLVVRGLTSTLQRLPPTNRVALAERLLQREAFSQADDLAMLAWFGVMPLAQSSPEQLTHLAQRSRWPLVNRFIARAISSQYREHPERLDQLLSAAINFPDACQSETLMGMYEAFAGWHSTDPPDSWHAFSQLASVSKLEKEVRDLNVMFGDGRAMEQVRELVLDNSADMRARKQAMRTLIDAQPSDLAKLCERVLNVRGLNAVALGGLAQREDLETAKQIVRQYRAFEASDRPQVIDVLLQRSDWAKVLLDAIEKSQHGLSPQALSAAAARQIHGLGDPGLQQKLALVWGKINNTNEQRRALIAQWTKRLDAKNLGDANLHRGRALFDKTCASCHMLFGSGQKVGPDLTGAQRSSLEYLLENMLDPSAVVPKDYRMSIVETVDGRVLNGLIVSRDGQRLVIQTAARLVTLPNDDVQDVRQSELSAMPDGLLQAMTPDQVRDLVAYLMSPVQVVAEDNQP